MKECLVAVDSWYKPGALSANRRPTLSGGDINWGVLLLPIVLGIRSFSQLLALLCIVSLAVVTLVTSTGKQHSLRLGPLVLLAASAAIVYVRPDAKYIGLFFITWLFIIVRLAATVDARVIIASLFDGIGLYLMLNVLGYAAGLRSPNEGDRIGGIVEATGFIRRIYPFSSSLDAVPTIAAAYVAALIFFLRDPNSARRNFRLAGAFAAASVLYGGGARTGLVVAVFLPIAVLVFPSAIRWMAQVATVLASVSVLVIPTISRAVGFITVPIVKLLSPNRAASVETISSLSNRDIIWSRSINYWFDYVPDAGKQLLGFGQNGQYLSGASRTYRSLLLSVSRYPELGSVHNSFLQQLYDGGLIGLILLVIAIFWTANRLSHGVKEWGSAGIGLIVMLSAFLLAGIPQVSLAPGFSQEAFWLLMVIVAVSCQCPSNGGSDSQPSADLTVQQSQSVQRGLGLGRA